MLYCDIDVINYSIGELEDSKIKLCSRTKCGLSGFLQIYNDEYETVNDVPENMWMNDTPNDDGDEQFRIAHLTNVTLSSDHRVVDGALAAQWG